MTEIRLVPRHNDEYTKIDCECIPIINIKGMLHLCPEVKGSNDMTDIYYILEGFPFSHDYVARIAFTTKQKAIDYLENVLDLVKSDKYSYWEIKRDPLCDDGRWWKIERLELHL
jgi:hypothetical protein